MKIKIVKSTFGGVEFLAQPKVLHLGGMGSAGVERLEFELPREWRGCAVTLHVEQEGGALPQPILLDAACSAVVDKRFTAVRRGLWMLLAVDGNGYTAVTKPAQYVCTESIDLNPTLEDIPQSVYEQFVQMVLKGASEAANAAASAAGDAKKADEARGLSQAAAMEAKAAAGKAGDGLTNRERWWILELLKKAAYTDKTAEEICKQLDTAWRIVRVENLTLDKNYCALNEGESTVLTAAVLPQEAADRLVYWDAGGSDIVELRPFGEDQMQCAIRAVKEGMAMICATAGTKQAFCALNTYPAIVAVESIALSQSAATVTEGKTLTLTAAVKPDNATDKTVTWAASPDSVVGITTSGEHGETCTVLVKGVGSAVVTASAQGHTATCTITAAAKPVEVSSIKLDSTALSLTEGDTARLTATVLPDNATDKTVTWTTDAPAVATVANGVVTAKGAGAAIITAAAGSKTARCVTNVAAKKVYYTVAYKLTHMNSSNTTVVVEQGQSFYALLTVESGYQMSSVSCTMGGADVAVTNNTVNLAAVTGNIIITATAEAIRVQSVTLSQTSLALTAGDTATLTATVTPDNALNKAVSWTTTSSNVATVSGGTVTARAAGSAIIRATADGVSADCSLTVAKKTNITNLAACIYNTRDASYDFSNTSESITYQKSFIVAWLPNDANYVNELEIVNSNPSHFKITPVMDRGTYQRADGNKWRCYQYRVDVTNHVVGEELTVYIRAGTLTAKIYMEIME
nr:MAG TPA: Tail tube protein [Siphoviridae sp. cttZS1]